MGEFNPAGRVTGGLSDKWHHAGTKDNLFSPGLRIA
jgi:hypothetical protein